MRKLLAIFLLLAGFMSGCNNLSPTIESYVQVPEVHAPTQPNTEITIPDAPIVKEQEGIPEEAPETSSVSQDTPTNTPSAKKGMVIVLDPGHGKSSSLMSDSEKTNYGYTYVEGKGWGEWRHFKSGTMWHDCNGYGCSGRAPANGGCWYPIGYGDRDIEPDLTYNNALNAKKNLEDLGYTVRLTRTANENPSLTQRLKYCYPNRDTSAQPDAAAYVCIHSNAGGGKGSCYIALSGLYDQSGIPGNYVETGNALGKSINDTIVQTTSLTAYGNGRYNGYPELVLFCKSPVPVAYLEIGFYDNAGDLGILRNESPAIGKAIADGIHAYFTR